MSEARRRRRADEKVAKAKGRSVRGPSSVPLPSPPIVAPLSLTKAAYSGLARWVSLALVAANLVVYAPVRQHDFVRWDDPQYVSENPHVLGGLTWRSVGWAFTTGYAANWFPMTWLSLMLDAEFYGLKAGGYLLTNLLLHIANTVLLFGLLHGMTGALGRSAFVAALFAVHPLHVESVAWVTERKDVLSTLFWMLTLWAYVGYVGRPRLGRYLGVLLFFALGLMSKPMLVTLPFVLLLLDVWPLGRLSLGANAPGLRSAPYRDQWSVALQLVREKLPLFALTMASAIVTFVVQQEGGAVTRLDTIPLTLRVENAVVSYVAYLGKMLWPTRLAAFYPYPPSLPGWEVAGSLLVLAAVSLLVIRAARRHPYLPVGWLWYLGTFVPVIGLVQVGNQAMADRYTYVPLIGIFMMVGWGIPDLLLHRLYRKVALPAAAGLVLLVCAILARDQVHYWKNNTALWERALAVTTGNHLAHNNLGFALAAQGKVSEAIGHYIEALRLKPNFAEAHNNVGNALAARGRVSDAVAHYTDAIRLEPDIAEVHSNLGAALVNQGRVEQAIAHYSEALRLEPDNAKTHNNLGVALATQRKVGEAIRHYTAALRLQPEYAEAHNNLGIVLADQGRVNEAFQEFSAALRLQPDYADAHYNLGVLLRNQRKLNEAIREFSETLRINPNHPRARRALDELISRGPQSNPSPPDGENR